MLVSFLYHIPYPKKSAIRTASYASNNRAGFAHPTRDLPYRQQYLYWGGYHARFDPKVSFSALPDTLPGPRMSIEMLKSILSKLSLGPNPYLGTFSHLNPAFPDGRTTGGVLITGNVYGGIHQQGGGS